MCFFFLNFHVIFGRPRDRLLRVFESKTLRGEYYTFAIAAKPECCGVSLFFSHRAKNVSAAERRINFFPSDDKWKKKLFPEGELFKCCSSSVRRNTSLFGFLRVFSATHCGSGPSVIYLKLIRPHGNWFSVFVRCKFIRPFVTSNLWQNVNFTSVLRSK